MKFSLMLDVLSGVLINVCSSTTSFFLILSDLYMSFYSVSEFWETHFVTIFQIFSVAKLSPLEILLTIAFLKGVISTVAI